MSWWTQISAISGGRRDMDSTGATIRFWMREYHQIELLGAPDGHIETAVVGNSHYSKDWFGFARLPHFEAEQLVGAYMIIYDVGAYGESMSDPWADIPRPAAVMVEGESHWLVTERETLQELAEDRRQRRHDQAASLAQAPPLPGYRDI